MVPNKRHPIIEINDGLVYWRAYAQLGIDELMVHCESYSMSWLNEDSLLSVECVTHKSKDSGGADDSSKHWWVTIQLPGRVIFRDLVGHFWWLNL